MDKHLLCQIVPTSKVIASTIPPGLKRVNIIHRPKLQLVPRNSVNFEDKRKFKFHISVKKLKEKENKL